MFTSNSERRDLIKLLDLIDEVVGETACSNFPEAFFSKSTHYEHGDWAKRMCSECPVLVECLTFALKHPQHGIWGGLTERERADMVRANRRPAHQRYVEPRGRTAS